MTAQWPSFPLGLPTRGRDTRRHNRRLLCDITLALLGSTWWVSVAHQTTLQGAPTSLSFLLLFLLLLFLHVILCNRWHSWRLVYGKDTVENKTKNCTFLEGREKNYYLRGLLTQVPVLLSSWEVAQERSRWHGELGEQKKAREGGKGSRQCWNRLRFRWAFTSSKWKLALVWAVFFVMGMILLIKFYYWNTRNLEPVTSQVALSLEGYLLIQHILLKVSECWVKWETPGTITMDLWEHLSDFPFFLFKHLETVERTDNKTIIGCHYTIGTSQFLYTVMRVT